MTKRSSGLFLFVILMTSLAWAADDTPPDTSKKKMTLQDLLSATAKPTTHASTVAGVRGLDETNAGIDTKARDFAAIDKLDKVTLEPDELKKFLQEGNLK